MNLVGLTAEPVLSDMKGNGTAKDAKHAKGSGAEHRFSEEKPHAASNAAVVDGGVRLCRVSHQGCSPVTPPQSFASFAFFAVPFPCSCRHHLAGPLTPAGELAPGAASKPMRRRHNRPVEPDSVYCSNRWVTRSKP